MAKPRLSKFLLKLATDPDTFEVFKDGDDDARDALMKAAGVSRKQRESVLSGDPGKVIDDVNVEMKRESIIKPLPGRAIIHLQLCLDLSPDADE